MEEQLFDNQQQIGYWLGRISHDLGITTICFLILLGLDLQLPSRVIKQTVYQEMEVSYRVASRRSGSGGYWESYDFLQTEGYRLILPVDFTASGGRKLRLKVSPLFGVCHSYAVEGSDREFQNYTSLPPLGWLSLLAAIPLSIFLVVAPRYQSLDISTKALVGWVIWAIISGYLSTTASMYPLFSQFGYYFFGVIL